MRKITKIAIDLRGAIAMLSLIVMAGCAATPTLRPASPENPPRLPRDQGAHFDAVIEWWYYTGHIEAKDGSSYGFELVFFKGYAPESVKFGPVPLKWLANPTYAAHFAIADKRGGGFAYDTRLNVPWAWTAGADEDAYRVWNAEWRAEGTGGEHRLRASMKDYSIDLRLSPSKPPAFHGKGGVVDMGKGGGSYYYSYTRMKVEGNITAGGAAKEVEGIAWMDHQWGSWDWRAYRGWDWFSLQLDDGTELMLFNFRDDSGGIQQESSGTIVYPDGNTERLSSGDFQVISLDQWKSTHSGATYPVDWQVAVPGQGMELRVRPVGLDRELNIEGSTYWEGPVIVEGRSGGGPVTGVGYAEMTGYARR